MPAIIVTAINEHPQYQAHLMVMLESFLRTNAELEECKILGATYNAAPAYWGYLRDAYGDISDVRAPIWPGMNGAQASHVRGELLCAALSSEADAVVWMDPDVIIRGSLEGLLSNLRTDSLRVMFRAHHEKDREWCAMQDGVYALGNGRHVRRMITRLREQLRKHHEWYADQHQLFRAWKRYSTKVKLEPLGVRWNDNRFADESPIWHARNSFKWGNPAWCREWLACYEQACERTGIRPWNPNEVKELRDAAR